MNRNEWEQRMKDLLEAQPFRPEEDSWLKLSAALQPPASPAKPKRVLFTPVRMAAAAVLLLSAGAALFFSLRPADPTVDKIAFQPARPAPEKPATRIPAQPAADIPKHYQPMPAPATRQAVAIHSPAVSKRVSAWKENATATTDTAQQTVVAVPSAPKQGDRTSPFRDDRMIDPWQGSYPDGAASKRAEPAIRLGVNALVSSSTISPVTYQAGIMGRGNLSGKVYVEAGLSLASNTVSSANKHTFSTVQHDATSGMSNISTQEVEADYSKNIVSLGFTPSLGIRATRKLSVSAGAAINRNLNTSLAITNSSEIASEAFDKNIVSTRQGIANWDIGITCNADYKITPNLSMNLGYRKGLSDYILQNNAYLRNSGIQFGLKYLFGSHP